MKHRGCSIIFSNRQDQVLLLLRDDKPDIAFPGMWDLPGGHIEENETPTECIRREMLEELCVDIGSPSMSGIYAFSDRYEYVFSMRAFFDIDEILLQEGQKLEWFSERQAAETVLAYGFNKVLSDFFEKNRKR
ncbi:NUDIX hydrolase [Prosthecochloris sp. GSB1]|uniref:NUDIX hydrolase n=1 Tax=Prosthecochloris sp. GSB1 TaxID=281093 RepID=UPI000B8C8EE4|nr:NUDIX hydrolase [Prosthecochloris sp. GSB1]ASQ90641.1 NUDIX hydrolase [Prosthecochloris sp. GSB1]